MSSIKRRIEIGFEAFAALLCQNRIVAILAVLVIAAGFASGVRDVVIDTSTESFLHPDDPIQVLYEDFRAEFGRDDFVVVAVESGALFTPSILDRLKSLHDALARDVPHLANITSMINVRSTLGEEDRLVVGELLDHWPESDQDFASLRHRLVTDPLYRRLLISDDGTVTTIALELSRFSDVSTVSIDSALLLFDEQPIVQSVSGKLTDTEIHQALSVVQEIVASHQAEDFTLRVAGTPVVTDELKILLQSDMRIFVALAIGMIALILFAMFRTVAAIVLPLCVVVLAVVSTVGLMGHLGTAVTLPIVILPSFLLAVGVGASVHLLAIYARNSRAGMDRNTAIIRAMGHTGLPILLTSLTTAAGLGSFAAAEVAPIGDLGRFAAFGVLIAFVYTMMLLPAGLGLFSRHPRNDLRSSRAAKRLDRVLVAIASWSVRHAAPIVGASVVLLLISVGLASQLRFSHDVLNWLPDDWPVHQATRAIDHDLGGTVALEILLDTHVENGLHDRETLIRIETAGHRLESGSSEPVPVGAVISIVDMLKEINRALNENQPDEHRIPENPRLIPQEFLLFENSGSDDLKDFVDSRFSLARVSIRVPWRDTLVYPPFIRHVEATFHDLFGNDVDITTTGIMSIMSRTLEAAIRSAAQSYCIAFGVITLMMIALIGRLGTGLISMLPNLAPIALALALMEVANIPLNLFTMLVGSIAVGLAVDDTVHFMHHFHRYLARTGNVEEAVRKTLLTSGRAMLATSVALSMGFFIFCVASMKNLVDFGLLTGITILTALVADFVLAPALMALRFRRSYPDSSLTPSGEKT